MSIATSLPETSSIAAPTDAPIGPESGLPADALYEVVDGKIVEKVVGVRQVAIANNLVFEIEAFARPRRAGRAVVEMIFLIDAARDLRRRPDAAFISDARWPFRRPVPDAPAWDVVPDLAVEVVSPSNTAAEIHGKIHEYFQAGARTVWVVYTDGPEIYVYRSPRDIQVLRVGDELDGGDFLPGFRLPMAELFEDENETETRTETERPS